MSLNGNHSDMVKFSENDRNGYEKICNVLKNFIKDAPSIIKARKNSLGGRGKSILSSRVEAQIPPKSTELTEDQKGMDYTAIKLPKIDSLQWHDKLAFSPYISPKCIGARTTLAIQRTLRVNGSWNINLTKSGIKTNEGFCGSRGTPGRESRLS